MSDKNIIKFKLPSERRTEDARRQKEANPPVVPDKRTQQPPGRRKNEILEAIIKSEDDHAELVMENLQLKKNQEELLPALGEHVLYYVTVAFGFIVSFGWIIGSFIVK